MLSGLLPGFTFAAPAILGALVLLPALYLLLRASPPAPRRQSFPALRLLRDLPASERTPARMPLWLLLLRLLAAALVIVGFAGPEIVPPKLLPGTGPVLLAIDNGWASVADFPARIQAARRIAAQAGSRGIVLLATAPDTAGHVPAASGVLTPHQASLKLGALHPQPWPTEWPAAAAAVRAARRRIAHLTGVGISTGLAGPGLGSFRSALRPARMIESDPRDVRLLLPPKIDSHGRLLARVAVASRPRTTRVPVLAETQDGGVLARLDVTVKPGSGEGSAPVDLPAALANRLARLVVANVGAAGVGAGAVALLDAGTRRLTVGLAAGPAGAERKFLGALYYVRRALPADATIRRGRPARLAAEDPAAIILADTPLGAAARPALHRYVAGGGVLIRFFGPRSAAAIGARAPGGMPASGGLLPDPLLPRVRVIGGALSGSGGSAGAGQTQRLAPFPADSPLDGLTPPGHFRISRQVLADPTRLDPSTVWARLADGTPLMLGKHLGRGATVAVLTTANADWSDWPLAADFPAVIARLVHLGAGSAPTSGTLQPLRVLDGEGRLIRPGPAARPLPAQSLSSVRVSPAHPPGLWGDSHGAAALDLGGHVPPPKVAPPPSGVPVGGLTSVPEPLRYGPDLLAAALALLTVDLAASILLRGLVRLRPGRLARGAGLVLIAGSLALAARGTARAEGSASAGGGIPSAALSTELAYVRTGAPAVDSITRAGLTALSLRVDLHTAAHLGAPRGVVPGKNPLALYPLLYWPIAAAGTPPGKAGCRALDAFMASGGLLVIDTEGGGADAEGSGAGFHPGARAALERATACLDIPPLVRLGPHDTLAHSFYLLRGFPGRFDGAPVEIAAKGARDPDGTSPVVIGADDWVGAWAEDDSGAPLQALIPGGGGQRERAERFGVNLVMYALTGTYKSDQVQLPTLLKRLGQ